MRQCLRVLGTAFTCSLLVLAILLAVQSVRSLWKTDILTFDASRPVGDAERYYRFHVVSKNGRVVLSGSVTAKPFLISKDALAKGPRWAFSLNSPTYLEPNEFRSHLFLGFTYVGPDGFSRMHPGDCTFRIGAPWWAMTLTASVIPIVALSRRWRQRRNVGRGHCRTCGYDLRATPDRCPECGMLQAGMKNPVPRAAEVSNAVDVVADDHGSKAERDALVE